MNKQELACLVILASMDAYEVYYRFNEALHKILLVEDPSGCFLGVIGVAELGVALVPGQTAEDLCNQDCTTLRKGENLVARGRDVFYEHSFFHLPVLSEDGRLADLLLRSDYFEFRVLSYAEGWEDVLLCLDRVRDINLNLAVGTKRGTRTLYAQDTLSTFVTEYARIEGRPIEVDVDTLAAVCNAHVPQGQEVHFLKVDVEGFEEEVLRSANFTTCRPWVVMMEATRPRSEVPTHGEWEDILLRNDYMFVKQYSINRFYLAREKSFLADRFLE